MSFGPRPKEKGLASSGLTKETQALLQDAFKKRGLSQRGIAEAVSSLQGNTNEWVDTLSTGTARFQPPSTSSKPKVHVPKVGLAAHKPIPMPPASFSGKRMNIPAAERDQYSGGYIPPDRDTQKDRCAQLMEVGAKGLRERQAQKDAQEAARLAAAREQSKPIDPKEALADALVEEIQERREFLEAMRALGRAQEHEHTIKAEIQARLTRLKSLGVDTGPEAPRYAPLPPWQRHQPKPGAGRA